MHVNILQYQHYLKLHDKEKGLNRITGLEQFRIGYATLAGVFDSGMANHRPFLVS